MANKELFFLTFIGFSIIFVFDKSIMEDLLLGISGKRLGKFVEVMGELRCKIKGLFVCCCWQQLFEVLFRS